MELIFIQNIGGTGRGIRPSYRPSTHIFSVLRSITCSDNAYLYNTIRHLMDVTNSALQSFCPCPSTHIIFAKYCPSTHIYTVLPPTLLGSVKSLGCFLGQTFSKALTKCGRYISTTVLPPIKVPFFDTPTYRSSTQEGSVPRPTKIRPTTVPPHRKEIGNLLNRFKNSTCKVVLKDELKRSSLFDDALFLLSKKGISTL